MSNPRGRTDSIESHDADSLRRLVATVRELLAPALRLAGDPADPESVGLMQTAGIERLNIRYIESARRAMGELSRWGSACDRAWSDNCIQQGAPTSLGGKARMQKRR